MIVTTPVTITSPKSDLCTCSSY